MKKITKLLNFLAPLGFTLFICLDAFARAGGGSNGNGGWDEFLISIAFAPLFLAYGIYRNRQINTRAKEVSIVLEKLKQKDLNWDEAHLSALVKNTFFTAQKAWCEQDLNTLREILAPQLFEVWKVQIDTLRSKQQKNVMDDLAINDIRFVSVQHFKNRMKDTFTVCIDAEASDYTVDTTNNIVSSNRRFKLLKKDDTEKSLEKFQEFWTFARKDESHWVLAAVDSSTAWKKSIARALVNEDGAA